MSSATERALVRHLSGGQGANESARQEGIAPSTLYRALGRMRGEGIGTRTLIAGAGALGRELASWMRRWNAEAPIWFLDDAFLTGTAADLDLRGIVGALAPDAVGAADRVMVAVADPAARAKIVHSLAGKMLAQYIDPTSIIGQAEIGDGALLFPVTLVSDRTTIGRHVILNTYSSIGHDCVVGDFCTFASYVCLTGGVRIGDGVSLGVGAKVLPKVRIGDGATIGAGAVVCRDVPEGATVFGVPAKAIA